MVNDDDQTANILTGLGIAAASITGIVAALIGTGIIRLPGAQPPVLVPPTEIPLPELLPEDGFLPPTELPGLPIGGAPAPTPLPSDVFPQPPPESPFLPPEEFPPFVPSQPPGVPVAPVPSFQLRPQAVVRLSLAGTQVI